MPAKTPSRKPQDCPSAYHCRSLLRRYKCVRAVERRGIMLQFLRSRSAVSAKTRTTTLLRSAAKRSLGASFTRVLGCDLASLCSSKGRVAGGTPALCSDDMSVGRKRIPSAGTRSIAPNRSGDFRWRIMAGTGAIPVTFLTQRLWAVCIPRLPGPNRALTKQRVDYRPRVGRKYV